MKIEICAPSSPMDEATIWADGKHLRNPKSNFFPLQWDDEDIANLLTEKQFEDYQSGIYTFNIPSWKYSLITCKRAAKDNAELKFISYFH